MLRVPIGLALFLVPSCLFAAPSSATQEKSVTPVEARERVSERVVVEMFVKTTKDRLEKRGEIYLDSEEDFRSERNFAVVITKAGAADLKKHDISNPAAYFQEKTIRAEGTVKVVDDLPRIEIDEARQIRIVDKKHP